MKRLKTKGFISIILVMTAILTFTGCSNSKLQKDEEAKGGATESNSKAVSTSASESKEDKASKDGNPIVTIEMESGKTIKIELYPDIAPNTVKNFISLVKSGFYDGLIFHRVIPGFMIQGGDPEGVGFGGPGYSIKGEFNVNGFTNQLKHTRGIISMARGEENDTAGSQFFIMVKEYPSLDNMYAAFGNVIEGIETADEIVAVETVENDMPKTPQVMKKVTVELFGKTYEEPEKIK